MRISSKGRYALASMVVMAQSSVRDETFTVIGLSKRLDISKIYLEQVFALLRRGGLVLSTKGAQGGYSLARAANKISAADILRLTETALFDEPETRADGALARIERALGDALFSPVNEAVCGVFERATLADLAQAAAETGGDDGDMYCI